MCSLSLLLLGACVGKPSLDDPLLSNDVLRNEEFFDGYVIPQCQFQDTLGTVRCRFDVDIRGTWDGKVLTLIEDFAYADGANVQRIWQMTRTRADTWKGTADGVLGLAEGRARGETFNWRYQIDLPVPNSTFACGLTIGFGG